MRDMREESRGYRFTMGRIFPVLPVRKAARYAGSHLDCILAIAPR